MGTANENDAWTIYMDIGQNAVTDTSTVDPEKDVSAVDSIYNGTTNGTPYTVSIAQEKENDTNWNTNKAGNFIIDASGTLYEATKTCIYFEKLNKVLAIVFVRPENGKNDSNNTLKVTVTPTADKGEIRQTKTSIAVIQ